MLTLIMGLSSSDPVPTGISRPEAYERIRSWYQNLAAVTPVGESQHLDGAREYIDALPEVADEAVISDCLQQVVAGGLEFAYHDENDGFKNAAYAHEALRSS
jgi:hypothetical protein